MVMEKWDRVDHQPRNDRSLDVGLFRRKPTSPVEVVGVLLHPQNVQYWDEPWCLLQALGASGLPSGPAYEGTGWASGADDVQRQGNIYLTLITSPAGNVWEARWAIEQGEFVRYMFVAHDPGSPQTPAEAAQLETCCDARGGCL